jgi:hypothetical protein
MVRLLGRGEIVGQQLGKILAPHIQHRVSDHLQLCREKGWDPKDREIRQFLDLLEEEAPHWIKEYQALANEAGVDFKTLLELNCACRLSARLSCTSALAIGTRTEKGFPLLVKVRDERLQHQAMGYRRIERTHGMLFSTDACNMGVGQGCNEFGLAVANNSGDLVPEPAEPIGFNDCQVTRLILERARNVDEGLETFCDLMERGRIGLVDGVRGMILILADPRGNGLVIEATRDKYETRKVDDGLAVWSNHWILPGSERFLKKLDPGHPLCISSRLRLERGMELLEGRAAITPADLEAFARDETHSPNSICNGTDAFPWRTVSAFVYELDPSLNQPVRVAAGNPTRTGFREIPLWAEETPASYLLDWKG